MKKFRTVHYEIGLKTDRAPLSFAHISDLHGCFYGERQEGLLEVLRAEKPDAVVATGDMIAEKAEVNQRTLAFLGNLQRSFRSFSAAATTRRGTKRAKRCGRCTVSFLKASAKTAW